MNNLELTNLSSSLFITETPFKLKYIHSPFKDIKIEDAIGIL